VFLKVASVDAFLMSDGSSFQSRGAATLNACTFTKFKSCAWNNEVTLGGWPQYGLPV